MKIVMQMIMLVLLLALFGCGDEKAVNDLVTGDATEENSEKTDKEKKKIKDEPSKTYEQYVEEALQSERFLYYTKNSVSYDTLDVDLDGDGIPELMVSHQYEDVNMMHWFVLQRVDGDWTSIDYGAVDVGAPVYFILHKLTEEKSEREAILVEQVVHYNPQYVRTNLELYTYEDEDNSVKRNFDLSVLRSIAIHDETQTLEYPVNNRPLLEFTYRDGDLYTNEGKRGGAIILDSLNDLLKTTINEYHILDTEIYSNVVTFVDEEPISEESYKGNACTHFHDFFVCKDGDDDNVSVYGITPQKKVTFDKLNKHFNNQLEIEKVESVDGEEITFEAELQLTDGTYVFEFSKMSSNAPLKMVYYTPASSYGF